MLAWLKKVIRVTGNYDRDVTQLKERCSHLEAQLRAMTTLNADIAGRPGPENYAVMIGRFANHDYVRIHPLGQRDFGEMVKHLQELNRLGRVGRIDSPIHMEAAIKRDMV